MRRPAATIGIVILVVGVIGGCADDTGNASARTDTTTATTAARAEGKCPALEVRRGLEGYDEGAVVQDPAGPGYRTTLVSGKKSVTLFSGLAGELMATGRKVEVDKKVLGHTVMVLTDGAQYAAVWERGGRDCSQYAIVTDGLTKEDVLDLVENVTGPR